MDKNKTRLLLNIIKKPIITDKTTKLIENNQYCFEIDARNDKFKIKEAIEKIFKVKVKKINTCHRPLKKRNVGRFKGYKRHYKKAIITLSKNDKINLFAED
uniref:Large ribosomal subunit protein uL23c n=1 Tax=Synarthrophyton chejuense TaxID=2485825 RepID=A0A3G3MFY6_9FLOR|nr:ribosomal protein L23 [Synarthrophyton chejuense]AYR05732.1 ribosomal protein L23 [Synarthrophyton chejuense]